MEVKLSSEEMEAAVIEYVCARVKVPAGFKLDVSRSYISGVTVYMEKDETPPEPEALLAPEDVSNAIEPSAPQSDR